MPAYRGNCIFCGDPNTTHEHVFSRWTHKYMLPRQKGRTPFIVGVEYLERSDLRTLKMPGQIRDWQIKCVCGGTHKTCNGGWMREIENAARPILVPLIKGEAARISPAHQPLIATWATLKAMVTDYDDDLKITTHHMQRKRMFVQHLPPKAGWGIWIGNYERVHWKPEWISTPFLLLPNKRVIKRASRKATYYNSNSITQVIGNLFIQLVHTPMPRFIERWRFPLPQGRALFRIWPPTQFSINWPPPPAFTDADADRIANAIPQYLRRLERERLAQEQHSSDQK